MLHSTRGLKNEPSKVIQFKLVIKENCAKVALLSFSVLCTIEQR